MSDPMSFWDLEIYLADAGYPAVALVPVECWLRLLRQMPLADVVRTATGEYFFWFGVTRVAPKFPGTQPDIVVLEDKSTGRGGVGYPRQTGTL